MAQRRGHDEEGDILCIGIGIGTCCFCVYD